MVMIATWSGPRNLSTAMMYAFGQHPDVSVWDEPFYGPFLLKSGAQHPMREAVLQHHDTDAHLIAARCANPSAFETEHVYMKHMAHHMIADMPLDWAHACVNVHLIRHPARVIASYLNKRDVVTMEDIGFDRQTQLYDRFGGVVIDSADIRRDPKQALGALCEAIGIPFSPRMLQWSKGGRPEDGVWAAHWYNAIHDSTGFAGPEERLPDIPQQHQQLLNEAMSHYEKLQAFRLLR